MLVRQEKKRNEETILPYWTGVDDAQNREKIDRNSSERGVMKMNNSGIQRQANPLMTLIFFFEE